MSTQKERKEIYGTPRWRRLRNEIMDRTGGLCAECLRQDRTVPAEIIHHIVPIRAGGDIWDRANLEPLCRLCHEEVHKNDCRLSDDEKRLKSDVERIAEIRRKITESIT